MSALRVLPRTIGTLIASVLVLLGLAGLGLAYAPPAFGLGAQRFVRHLSRDVAESRAAHARASLEHHIAAEGGLRGEDGMCPKTTATSQLAVGSDDGVRPDDAVFTQNRTGFQHGAHIE